jgi:predicted N-acyltransferase
MSAVQDDANDYVTRILRAPGEVDAGAWDALLAAGSEASPFVRHAYLRALHESASAVKATGWDPHFVTLWRGDALEAACPLYVKAHSYGEYVFDWAWANAYEQHGLRYYPKGLIAVPYTPVPGPRLLARTDAARRVLLAETLAYCAKRKLSSLHILFASDLDVAAAAGAGLMLRHTVQFHWRNAGYADFDAFLASLSHDKRKKIRQERRKVADAGVTFRHARGADISPSDWAFFYRCYERTYLEHGNAPYLTPEFFADMAVSMPENWLLFVAERGNRPIASSLIALQDRVAYGRYWGALERVDCLHFEACYYQPLQWCIAHGYARFEGGAQGEHKMARALMPVKTTSAHWLAHPAFADAVEKFLAREGAGIENYLSHLDERSPFRHAQ